MDMTIAAHDAVEAQCEIRKLPLSDAELENLFNSLLAVLEKQFDYPDYRHYN